MKKLFLSLLIGMALYATSCANGKPVARQVSDLPATAQSFLKKHFSTVNVDQVLENHSSDEKYEVKLAGGGEIEFDKNGNWTKIDCQRNAIPESVVPAKILQYVKQNYPNHFVSSIDKEDGGYDVEVRDMGLKHDIDLKFNGRYEFMRID
ncbi:MAG: PepSY-like domain-containing protein [Rikenellaceae bacterium]|nr:PepSY-like domain-containing protein [Rikenellaceae bacterium]